MSDIITLKNPTTGEVWTSGKRGRKPKWVSDMEAAGTVIPKKIVAYAPKAVVSATPAVPGALRLWKWVGQNGEEGNDDRQSKAGRAMIIAADPANAIKVGNATFKYPLGASEFSLMWSEITDNGLIADINASGIDVKVPAVWHTVGEKWAVRTKA